MISLACEYSPIRSVRSSVDGDLLLTNHTHVFVHQLMSSLYCQLPLLPQRFRVLLQQTLRLSPVLHPHHRLPHLLRDQQQVLDFVVVGQQQLFGTVQFEFYLLTFADELFLETG